MKTNKILLLLVWCLMSFNAGQTTFEPVGLIEKIYAQTDRPLYFPGEIIWFKAYVVDGENKISSLSEVAYAELISPRGEVIKQAVLSIEDGYTYYQFMLADSAPGGRYTLKIYTRWMEQQGSEFAFTKELVVQNVVTPNLLLTLDLEKTAYGEGDKFQAGFTANDLENNPLANTEITYRTIIDGKTIATQSMQTDALGKALIIGQLPEKMTSTDALLLVNISYRDQVESISRSIPIIRDETDLQFLPEGGQALEGHASNFAFRAVNEFGKPVDVSGTIMDDKDRSIANFTSRHDGMGMVKFVPEKGRKYSAKITKPYQSKKRYPVSGMTNEGVHLYYLSKKQSFEILANSEKEIRISVFKNGAVVFQKNKKIKKGKNLLTIPISEFSMGIHKVVVENNRFIKLAERMVFFHTDRHLNIEIKTDKDRYQNREEMSVTLRTTDSNNNPVPANLSVGITDEKINNVADDKQGNILANLLLTSELKGKIHEPNYYFDKKETERFAHLDLVMMTHGWRSYLQEPILNIADAAIPPERGDWQTGIITDTKGNGIQAEFLLVNNNQQEIIRMKTDNDGNFRFLLKENTYYHLIAYQDNNKPVKINLNPTNLTRKPSRPIAMQKANLKKVDANGLKMPVPEVIEEEGGVFEIAMEEGVALSEVVVTGLGLDLNDKATGYAVSVVRTEDIIDIGMVNALMSKTAGVRIEENSGRADGNKQVSLRGTSTVSGSNPVFVVDGIVIKNADGESTVLDNLNKEEIESVSVIKGLSATAMYGSQGANGVVMIVTKNRTYYDREMKNFSQKKYKNYAYGFVRSKARKMDRPVQFYQPIYKYNNPEKRTDFRNTIYWNPVVQTDANGQATFTTFTSDALTSFAVTVEGISAHGAPGYQQKKIFTQKELSVNATMPAFLSVGDTLKLPVTIVNNSDEKRKGKVTINLPKGLKLLTPKMPLKYEVAANSFEKIYLTCLPLKPGKGQNIQIKIHAGKQKDELNQKVTIIRKDFPAALSLSGVGSKKMKFELTNPVENSIRAELKIYIDVIGQALDGIESSLREPHGCFEQTSSSTYPNVMILNYLRSVGEMDKTIEEKAMNYIKKGYKRLIGFETSKGGFEWFGKTPPHETLTAYGVLEFTDMKEVYDGVDQKMINRTISWLLSRKDGKGGFKKSERGLDSFGHASKLVANAYIVYALSKVGKIKATKKEYETALQAVLEDGDAYRLGLLLRAAQFRKDTENEKILLDKLKDLLSNNSWGAFPVTETIVRSGNSDKQVETAAFLVMGLLENDSNIGNAVDGIQFILGSRKYGRFGATQATCLAIESILSYAKKQEEKWRDSNGSIVVSINGHKEVKSFEEVENGILKIDQLEDFITAGPQELELYLLNAKGDFPFTFDVNYFTSVPKTHPNCPLTIATTVPQSTLKLGDNLRLEVTVKNTTDKQLPMTTALVGIPGGASVQPWQLKEIMDREEVAYYEIFDHYLVFYWRHFKAQEEKVISLDLKTEFAGEFESAPGCVYLYYTDQEKYWTRGEKVGVY